MSLSCPYSTPRETDWHISHHRLQHDDQSVPDITLTINFSQTPHVDSWHGPSSLLCTNHSKHRFHLIQKGKSADLRHRSRWYLERERLGVDRGASWDDTGLEWHMIHVHAGPVPCKARVLKITPSEIC